MTIGSIFFSFFEAYFCPWVFLVEASRAKVMLAAAIKRIPPLPFCHTFGLNAAFCHGIVAIGVV